MHEAEVAAVSLPRRRFPIGAEVRPEGGVRFRVWAPKRQSVRIVLASEKDAKSTVASSVLAPDGNGYFAGVVPTASTGMLYGFHLDDEPAVVPDPASRFQPNGPSGLSQIVDPRGFRWSDSAWKGVTIPGQVLYEMHVGTFTREGTWDAAIEHLSKLAETGITVLQVMPVADFLGTFGWGYDGVCMFAPTRLYGSPDGFRKFVDRAHALGMGVILDIVYNHFGTFGNYVIQFSDDYHSHRYDNEWGTAINFDGENSAPVREFFITNACYWIEEFHLDGFRFDATQAIHDASKRHILADIQEAARATAGPRSILLITENEPQDVRTLRPAVEGGYGFDGMINDDFHHSARVRTVGNTEAYYSDYRGEVYELLSAIKEGFIYQGQISQHQQKRRGTPSRGFPAHSFVNFLQNHDQVANTIAGDRIHKLTGSGRLRAMTALWLLSPQTPLFFQGQEFCCSKPFLYFNDTPGPDGQAIAKGRLEFLSQFPSLDTDEARKTVAVPAKRSTFDRCKMDWNERDENEHAHRLHSDLLKMRRDDPVFRRQRGDLLEGSALSADCLVLRFYDEHHLDRLLLVNFGREFLYSPSPEPLLAPPCEHAWDVAWSSENVRYGGQGTPPVETPAGWRLPATAAIVLRAVAAVIPDATDVKPISSKSGA
jgi:maltooligosyltrehalose trehalohydrolase